MDLKNNKAPAQAGSTDVGADTAVPEEIDLYDELVIFAELPPEEQSAKVDQAEMSRAREAESAAPELPLVVPPVVEIDAASSDPPPPSSLESNVLAKQNEKLVPENPIAVLGSGSLAGLTPESPFTGALTRGVCLSCGAESGVNDLFCVACGEFVDEAAPTVISSPTCSQCGLNVSPDEIFCPRCGALAPAS